MIEIKNLSKVFETSSGSFRALDDINITVEDGDIYGIIGMSGAGKSTLVRCINQIERQTEGQVVIDGQELSALSEGELRKVRRKVSMIFQSFNLLQQRTCLKNICFPMELEGKKKSEAVKRAKELLELVGLPDKANSYPSQLSGGQQQRIAIARALATDPEILLCDEATSALDPRTTAQVLDLIREINRKMGITVVVITHQMSVVKDICNKVAILDHGKVVEKGLVSEVFTNPQSAAARRLVFPDKVDRGIDFEPGVAYLSLTFSNAEATERPLIASLAMEKGISASIVSAATQNVGGVVFGKMLLGIPGDEKTVNDAMEYIHGYHGIRAEVLDIEEIKQEQEGEVDDEFAE